MTDVPEIETKLPRCFSQLHELLTRILRDNNILPNEEELKGEQLRLIAKTVMKL
jgi:hypothetical protein